MNKKLYFLSALSLLFGDSSESLCYNSLGNQTAGVTFLDSTASYADTGFAKGYQITINKGVSCYE